MDPNQNTNQPDPLPTNATPAQTPHPPENPTEEATQKKSILQTLQDRPLLVGVLILVAIIGSLGLRYLSLTKKTAEAPTSQYFENVLLVLDVQLDSQTAPKSLTVWFNNPVDVHEVSHFASLSPKILGKWEIDSSDKTIAHFKFSKKYKAASLWFYIAQGLTSTNNKTLINDYSKNLVVTNNTQYEPYSRVKSFPAGKPIPLYSGDESISVYKSNAQNLLSFLTYELENKERRGSVYDGTYTKSKIEHQENEKIANPAIDQEESTITLDPGVYYVEGDTAEPYFIVVSNFGVTLRQDDKKVLLGAFNMSDGTKITEGVTFGLYNLTDGVNLLRDFAYSESNNSQPLIYPTRLDVAIAIYKDEVAFIPVEIPSSLADIQVSSNLDTTSKIFLYTDRPIYKPGDTVFVRGVVRQDSDSLYKPPTAGSTVYLQRNENGKETDLTATLDEYGTFYTHYVLPKDSDATYSYVTASMRPLVNENYERVSASFEILKYVKPEFEIKTAVDKSEYLSSDKLKFTISGNYFNGKPLANKDIEYSLYTDNYYEVEKAVYNKNFNITSPGGMCGGGGFEEYFGNEYKSGKVTLNEKGQATLEVKSDDRSQLSQEITLIAKVVDENKNNITSGANTIVHASDFNIFFIPSAGRYNPGDEVVVPFYSERLNGEKIKNTAFDYKFIDYEYDYTNQKNTQETIITSGSIQTDENGKGIVKFTLPKDVSEKDKQLIVSTKDTKNNTAQNQKSISIISKAEREASASPYWGDSISQTYLKISSNQNSFKVNDKVNLTIESPRELDALLTFERGRIYDPRFIHLKKGANTLQFDVDEDLSPSITVVFSFFADGQYHTEGLSLNVPAMHKLLQIGLVPNKTSYSPTETAELLITTKDADGAPVAAQMSVGVVDKAIYALRKSATPPIHSSFYYFRPRRTNASSSLTRMGDWGGRGGGGGGGGENPGSTADVLYWNPTLRTDASGEVRISIPLLGHKTIWKVQVLGSTIQSQVGQADTEFIVGSQVKGAKTKNKK